MSINFQNYDYFTHAITVGGKLVEILLRKGQKDNAFIDALTFTIKKTTIDIVKGMCITDEEYIAAYSEILIDIFGFGVTEKRKGSGRYFYQQYYRLGSEQVEYGTVHIGGQRETILVELTGTACQAAKAGWEQRLYEFLSKAVRPSITRIDCAHDFFHGEYTPEAAMHDHDKGMFNRANKKPKSECKGTAWRLEDYTGKSFYIGRRGSSKLVRVYEKGRQLGDKESDWVRFEIEFRNKDCIIPLEILTAPGEFLTGAYPVGEALFKQPAQRIEASIKKAQITFESRLQHGKNQIGRLIRLLKDMGWEDEKIIESLIAESGQYPKGLDPMEYDCQSGYVEYMIQNKVEPEQKDELDEIVLIERDVRAFDQDTPIKTPEQQQLVNDFPQDLARWLKVWKEQKYYELSERNFEQFRKLKQESNEYLDYMYIKYGTLFPHFRNSKQRNLS